MTHIFGRLLVQAHLVVKQPRVLSEQGSVEHRMAIAAELKAQNTVPVAYYYCDPVIQTLAEETGGCVSDSLEMARFGNQHPAQTVAVVGVRSMGGTAKILNPERRVLMSTPKTTYPLNLGYPVDEFSAFCDQHPGRTVVVYANTSATVKARTDWVVTSSCAVGIVEHLMDNGGPILWAPDQHLGRYIRRGARTDMLFWDGACIVHEEFKAEQLEDMKAPYPDAAILIHPELPESAVALADAVGSTSQLTKVAQTLPNKTLIITTGHGIFYKMQQSCPDKDFIEVPTAGNDTACRSCAHCLWVAMNTLKRTLACLCEGSGEIFVDPAPIPRAICPLKHMLDFTQVVRLRQTRNT